MTAPARRPLPLDEARIDFTRRTLSVGSVDVLWGVNLQHRFAPHMHETMALGVVDAGMPRVWYRRRTSSGGRGAMIALSAGEMHTGDPGCKTRWSYRMLYPSQSVVRAALADERSIRDGRDPELLFPEAFVSCVQSRAAFTAAHERLSSNGCVLAAEEALIHAVRTMCTRLGVDATHRPKLHPRGASIDVAREYMHAHLGESIPLSRLAELVGVSGFHVIRLFRQTLGMPPHAYLKQLRVARAANLLRDSMAICDVAYRCGFSDQSHLTRAFKRIYGVPPGVYRRATDGQPTSVYL